MNEGHSSLLGLALLQEYAEDRPLHKVISQKDKEKICSRCVFTTHTPVPVGHDQFSLEMVREVLGEKRTNALISGKCCLEDSLNMTHMALSFSRYINGVAMRHGEISRNMFPNYPINSITNGVHALTWTSLAFCQLFDKHMPEWRRDSMYLRFAVSIPLDEIFQAHQQSKQELMKVVGERTGITLDPKKMTIGFARRSAAYKRGDLLFSDLKRLQQMAKKLGPLQIIYSGKAHPKDEGGKEIIGRIFEAASALSGNIKVVYLEEYDMTLGKYLTSGVDLWLNTPQKPHEASGTSGMKAALNGIPSLSVLDGWWIEGHIEGVTGWSIGESWEPESNTEEEITSLYDKLEYVILPMFYKHPDQYMKIMRSTIAINGSFFNAQRMLTQYVRNAYQAVAL
jgi:starch phosphorylase